MTVRSNIAKHKDLTLAMVLKDTQVLLGYKKKGFGQGYFNGFGGKVEQWDQSIEVAAKRELSEEANIEALNIQKVGELIFNFDDRDVPWLVHVFRIEQFKGEPQESNEMIPQWFSYEDIPFKKMWADDAYWYPYLLQGKKFKGTFNFTQTTILTSYTLDEYQFDFEVK